MQIGYIRVSTRDQNPDLQRNALISAGCDQIYEGSASGKSTKKRPGLRRAMRRLADGDTLVVWKLDRLGRSMKDLVGLVGDIQARGAQFHSLTDSINTSTAAGRFFFHVMASLAEMERELIIERTLAGLEAARERGRYGGRPRKISECQREQLKALAGNGVPASQLAGIFGVHVNTIYRHLDCLDGEN
ncbi:DNA-invertase [Salmonella enterica subsp. enterica serovar Choleraesuis]|nr:DNA-invertase [Salmonella enterica subsp. enterica serovar Choleraesuis]